LKLPADNAFMVIRGRVQNGMIALESDILLPDGTEVVVTVRTGANADVDSMSEQDRRGVREIMDRIAALPDENPGDSFSGADHDRVLYAEP
jgi:hypothetical protein